MNSRKKDIDDSLEESTIVKINRPLENYIKVSVRNTVQHVIK